MYCGSASKTCCCSGGEGDAFTLEWIFGWPRPLLVLRWWAWSSQPQLWCTANRSARTSESLCPLLKKGGGSSRLQHLEEVTQHLVNLSRKSEQGLEVAARVTSWSMWGVAANELKLR